MYSSSKLWPSFRESVSSTELELAAATITSWQRHSGTAGEYQAVDYLLERLEQMGISAQSEWFDSLISNPISASLHIAHGERRTISGITHPFSASAPGGVTAELVPVEKTGADVDIAGKIVLVPGAGKPDNVDRWLRRGAVGIVCHSKAKAVQDYIISPIWGTPSPETITNLPDIPVMTVDDAAGGYLRNLLKNGEVRVCLRTLLDTGIKRLKFPVAEIGPDDAGDEFVMVAGHLDSWYYGAQDNGAGDAALLEIARVLNAHRNSLRRKIRIIWWVGHSQGRFSASTWYADRNWHDLTHNCVGYLNIDQPGHRDATWLKSFATPEAARFISRMAKELAGQDIVPARSPRAADQSFWGVGLPSFSYLPRLNDESPDEAPDAIGARMPWYQHTPFDTIDTLDFGLLADQSYYYCATLAELSLCERLPWDQGDTADSFITQLRKWKEVARQHLDLDPALAAAKKLKAVGESVRALADDEGDTATINRAVLLCSQQLLNVYFMRTGRFHQDSALTQPLVPGLAEVEQLVKLVPGSESYLFLQAKLVRERNRVTDALVQATEILSRALP